MIVPYGGAGLSCGIAIAIKAKQPEVCVYACELEHCPAFAAALAAGKPVEVDYRPTFIDRDGLGRRAAGNAARGKGRARMVREIEQLRIGHGKAALRIVGVGGGSVSTRRGLRTDAESAQKRNIVELSSRHFGQMMDVAFPFPASSREAADVGVAE